MAEALLGVQKQDELPKTLLPFTENALRVLARRYLKKTEDSRPAEARKICSRAWPKISLRPIFLRSQGRSQGRGKNFTNQWPHLIFCPIRRL